MQHIKIGEASNARKVESQGDHTSGEGWSRRIRREDSGLYSAFSRTKLATVRRPFSFSCRPTTTLAKNAAALLKSSSPCAIPRSRSAQRSFAAKKNGGMAK